MSKQFRKEEELLIGANIRRHRLMAGMSQQQLAERLGLTFQQVQKYEKGTNRVSGSRLIVLAKLFKTTTDGLLGHEPDRITVDGPVHPVLRMAETSIGVEIAEAFSKIKSPAVQRALADLMESVAESSQKQTKVAVGEGKSKVQE